jgi:hypothetical protein
MSNSAYELLMEISRQSQKDRAMEELSQLFTGIAQAAEKVNDPALRVQMMVSAAKGEEKIKALKALM